MRAFTTDEEQTVRDALRAIGEQLDTMRLRERDPIKIVQTLEQTADRVTALTRARNESDRQIAEQRQRGARLRAKADDIAGVLDAANR